MAFTLSYCDPLHPAPLELGAKEPEQILQFFRQVPWEAALAKLTDTPPEAVHCSASVDVKNSVTQEAVCISAVGEPADYAFHVFYIRPKRIRRFWGLYTEQQPAYMSELLDQPVDRAVHILHTLLRNDSAQLESLFG
ncbi:hypothetical protein [Hymenobacter rigui]|uniref:Uncharacterized protein n=1 Tax=Hymenobacter rigui TaxID=334424 RepID=A0A3R9NZT7_9BACT|nr:hypothetical protein [Hymenobacter rigui]RSK47110.1 hypothetical protein EI291_16055 [Hymenobacter rigui]